MSTFIIEQFWFGVYCILFGIFITLLYDLLLIARAVIPHSSFWVSVEDFLFWIGAAFGIFMLLYRMNYGELRWAAVLLLFLGMLLYKKIFGNILVTFMSTIIKRTLHLVVRVLRVPLKLVKRLFFQGFRRIKKCAGAQKNKLTGNIKKVNMILCKHRRVPKKTGKKGKKDESQKIP